MPTPTDILPTTEAKPDYVRAMFNRIAPRYDLVNDLMTGGAHRYWKRRMVAIVRPATGEKCADLATGTGDIARLLARKVGPTGSVIGLDFSAEMLAVAKARGTEAPINWLEGDMLALPFEDASLDVVTVGFGLRNVADLDQAFAEVARVLAPGGRFASLDLARPRIRWFGKLVDAFSFGLVPWIGKVVGGDSEAYAYLPASNKVFPDQDALGKRLADAGFEQIGVHDQIGGTLAIVSGVRSRPA